MNGFDNDKQNDNNNSKQDNGNNKQKKYTNDFLELNFSIFLDLLKLKKIDSGKAYFLIMFTFINLYMTNLHTYTSNLKINYPNTVGENYTFSLVESLAYLDVQQLIAQNQTVFMIIFVLAISYSFMLTLLYIIIYIVKKLYPHEKVRQYFFSRWFVQLAEYFSWICFFPFVIIYLTYLLCNVDVLDAVGISCESSPQRLVYQLFAGLGLAFAILNEWWLSLFFQNSSATSKKDMLKSENFLFLVYFNFFRLAVGVCACVRVNVYGWFQFYLVFNSIISGSLIGSMYFGNGLLTFKIQSVRDTFTLMITAYFSQSVAFFFDELCRVTNLFHNDDADSTLLLIFCFSAMIIYTFRALTEHQMYYILMENKISIKDSQYLKKKMYYMSNLNDSGQINVYNETFFKGILQMHMSQLPTCKNSGLIATCFCKQKSIYDAKKRKEASLDKCYQTQFRSMFTKYLMKSWIEICMQNNPHDYTLYIDYAEFLSYKLNNMALALGVLLQIEDKFMYPTDKFRVYRLHKFISKSVQKHNIEAYKGCLEIESVIPTEQKIDEIQHQILLILQQNVYFWEILDLLQVNLFDCNQVLHETQQYIDSVKKMWISINKFIDYRKKWHFYYSWYYLYILNKKPKLALLDKFNGSSLLNENEIFSEDNSRENQSQGDDAGSVISNDGGGDMTSNMHGGGDGRQGGNDKIMIGGLSGIRKMKTAFENSSCVFHVDNDVKGKIIKVNKPVYSVFGYQDFELENIALVQNLMPRIFRESHSEVVKSYISIGRERSAYSQSKVFCLHKEGVIFPMYKFLKLYITPSGRANFVAMLRPIMPAIGDQKVSYMILNDNWDIDSMSYRLHEELGIDSKRYQNQIKQSDGFGNGSMILNLLVCAPKLLKYSRFAKYLNFSDMSKLGFCSRREVMFGKNIKQNLNADRSSSVASQMEIRGLGERAKAESIIDKGSSNIDAIGSQLQLELHQKQKNININIKSPLEVLPEDINESKMMLTSQSHRFQDKNLDNSQVDIPFLPQESEPSAIPQYSNIINQQTNSLLDQPNYVYLLQQQQNIQKGSSKSIASQNSRDLKSYIATNSLPQSEKESESDVQVQKANNKGQDKSNFNQQKSNLSSDSVINIVQKEEQSKEIRQQQADNELQQMNQQLKMFTDPKTFVNPEQLAQNKSSNVESKSSSSSSSQPSDGESIQKQQQDNDSDSQQSHKDNNYNYQQLSNGDVVKFIMKIPYNVEEFMQQFFVSITTQIQIFDKVKSNKTLSHAFSEVPNSKLLDAGNSKVQTNNKNINIINQMQTNFSDQSLDQQLLEVIKKFYTKYLDKHKCRQFKVSGVFKFQRFNKKKICIIKITQFEEIISTRLRDAGSKNAIQFNVKIPIDQTIMLKQISRTSIGQMVATDGQNKMQSNRAINTQVISNGSIEDHSLTKISNSTISPIKAKENGLGYQCATNVTFNISVQPGNRKRELTLSNNNAIGNSQMDNQQPTIIQMQNELAKSLNNLHKDFQNQEGQRTFSLNSTDNIYIKEDNHKPKKNIRNITNMKNFMRLFFLLLISLNLITFFVGPKRDYNSLENMSFRISQTLRTFMNVLDFTSTVMNILITNIGQYDQVIPNYYPTKEEYIKEDIQNKLLSTVEYMKEINRDEDMMLNLFDSTVLDVQQIDKQTLQPISQTQSKAAYKLDSLDLLSQYVFYTSKLQLEQDLTIITIQHGSVQFIRDNVFPYIYDIYSSIVQNLIDNLNSTISNIESFLIAILIIESCLVFLSFLILLRLILQACATFQAIIESYPMINSHDLKKIRQYSLKLLESFTYLVRKDQQMCGQYVDNQKSQQVQKQIEALQQSQLPSQQQIQQNPLDQSKLSHAGSGRPSQKSVKGNNKSLLIRKKKQQIQVANDKLNLNKISEKLKKENITANRQINLSLEETYDMNNNAGKKSKQIEQGRFLKKMKVKLLIYYIVFILISTGFSIFFLYDAKITIDQLQSMMTNGQLFIQPASLNVIMLIAMKEKLVDPLNYNQVFKVKINALIQKFINSQKQITIDSLNFANFDEAFNIVYYGNPCVELSFLLEDHEIQLCQSVAFKSLVHGMSLFNSNFANVISDYLVSDNSNRFGNITSLNIFDFDRAIYFGNIFTLYLIDLWQQDMIDQLNFSLTFLSAFISFMIIIQVIIYLIFSEKLLIGCLEKEYAYFRQIYKMYMPEAIIQKEKRIKFWLIKHDVLNK